MQRSISNKKYLTFFIYASLYFVYIGLSSIYLILPPLLSVLYIFFSESLKKDNTILTIIVVFCLVLFESEKSYYLFTSVIYFILIYKFVIPKLKQNFSCKSCINFMSVVIVYVGFYFFCLVLSKVFLFPMPSISMYVFYYIFIEFLIITLL
jgi:hypothetical protein